ncbi:MAG: DUF2236 domain-containing protein [Candidatus Daviesbacteria bacterium]|nr:MAG: DUF2236 domain-containing protein [Candidatus Daviesbacteria bacterium]
MKTISTGYFAPESIFRKVWRERLQLLGATRALLMQLAHPLVASGVAGYSHFQSDPLKRLHRTVDTMVAIIFGEKSQADAALAKLNHIHQQVKGKLPFSAGPFPKGSSYSANDPDLKLWVHATLMDTGLWTYEYFVKPLSSKEKKLFYKDSQKLASLMGIPQQMIPPTLDDFNEYLKNMLESGVITVTPQAKKLAADIINPPVKPILKPFVGLVNTVAAYSLPKSLREAYGLKYTKGDQARLKMMTQAIQVFLPLTPPIVRFMHLPKSFLTKR